MSLKRKITLAVVGFVFFVLLLVSLFTAVYFYLPRYLENRLLPKLAVDEGISDFAVDVRNVGFFDADLGSLRIGPQESPALFVQSVQIDYSPWSLYQQQIDNITLSGIVLYGEISGGKFNLRGLDFQKLMTGWQQRENSTAAHHDAAPWITVKKLSIRNSQVIIEDKDQLYRVPVELDIVPLDAEFNHLNINIRVYPWGQKIAAAAKDLARGSKRLICTVFDEKQMAAKGMGGVLAVGSGSQNKPRFIILKYSPPGKAANNLPTVALVGKAITFDSGGISIKPSANMDEMKLDKTGGIAVLGAMKAIAELAPPVNVFGIVPSAENMPSGSSYRPGDIINTFSGKTVEVQNTDAEGRMILCDGINYAVRQKCDIIIDIATLTGACVVALGKYMAGLMGNDEGLIKELQKASEVCGEKVWPMPSGEEYAKEMKSKIADLKNIGSRWGGACTAAAFLGQFAGETKWAHLDIAGVWNFDKATEFTSEGASAFGVRLLTTYVLGLKGKQN